jgi:hypothetical protein
MMRKLVYGIVSVMTIVAMSLNVLAQTQSKQKAKQNSFELTAATPVTGTGTVGRISKWLSLNSIGDSNITEDKFGNVGIGTSTPTSRLTVQGMIETTLGGLKFPDGTIQTTAGNFGLTGVAHDATLAGDGTAAQPLGLAVPLIFAGSVSNGNGVITVTNIAAGGPGIFAIGGNASPTVAAAREY